MASCALQSARLTLWPRYKAVVPRRFSINSLDPLSSLLILASSRASGLGRAPLSPPPSPAGLRAPHKDTTKPVRRIAPGLLGCHSLEVSAALPRQLPGCGSPLGGDEG